MDLLAHKYIHNPSELIKINDLYQWYCSLNHHLEKCLDINYNWKQVTMLHTSGSAVFCSRTILMLSSP